MPHDQVKNKIRSLIFFDYIKVVDLDGESESGEWLQITRLNDIGRIDKTPQQKIVRLSESDQVELYEFLKTKFGR